MNITHHTSIRSIGLRLRGKRARARTPATLLLIVITLLIAVAPAHANPSDPATSVGASVTVTSTTAAVLDEEQAQEAQGLSSAEAWLVVATLAFGLAAFGILFAYTYWIQKRFYEASETLGRLGKEIKVTSTQPFVGERALAEQPPIALEIKGPGIAIIGKESEEFTATLADGSPADKAQWSVDPSNAAAVVPETGAKVKVIAALPGAFRLRAMVDGSAVGEVSVVALEPAAKPQELPFVGRGYGSIAVAILLIAAVIVLGLIGVLSGEGVATLLGGLLGYIFGVGIVGTQQKAAEGAGSGEPSQ